MDKKDLKTITEKEFIKLKTDYKTFDNISKLLNCNINSLREVYYEKVKNSKKKIRSKTDLSNISDTKIYELFEEHKSFLMMSKILKCGWKKLSCEIKNRKLNIKPIKKLHHHNESVFLNEDSLSYYLLGVYVTDRICF